MSALTSIPSNELSLKTLLQKNLNENANQYPPPINYLRKLSGQDKELNIIEVDHCYNKPWNKHPDNQNKSRPAKFLFMDSFPKHFKNSESNFDLNNLQIIDANQTTNADEDNPFIKEAIKFGVKVRDFDEDETFELKLEFEDELQMPASQNNWTSKMIKLYSGAIKILNSDRLSRLSYVNRENELILRKNLTEKTSSKFRYLFAAVAGWDF